MRSESSLPTMPPLPEGPDRAARSPLQVAALFFLVVLPVGHLVLLPVAGAVATGSDVALLILLLAWGMDLLAGPGRAARLVRALRGEAVPGVPSRGGLMGFALLLGFAGWVALSGLWGYHPTYAAAKGLGMGALVLGGLALATSDLGWRRLADGWLAGTALALIVTVLFAAVGSEALRARVYSGGSGILGLPFARVSGPLVHPNMFGGYLVVSGLVLWSRWPELEGWMRTAGIALASAVVTALLLTASTAWIGAGLVLALLGRRATAQGRRSAGTLMRVGGLVVAAAVMTALIVPLDFRIGWIHVVTNAIRPDIWRSALDAVAAAPLMGVGASPYVAQAVDPLRGGAMGLWDAHNAYLSVLGQFGVVGFALAAMGVWRLVAGVRAAPSSRARTAVLLILVAVAVHAGFLASEDMRHVWMVMGMCGVVGGEGGS